MPDRPATGAPDANALAALFEQHKDGLAGAARAILGAGADVAAVLQDAFVRALRSLPASRPAADPVAWIYVVTMNLARDQRRRDRRHRARTAPLPETMPMDPTTAGIDPRARAENAEALAAARAAIQRLAEPQKEVFLLRVAGGLTFEAAAEALGIPVGTAKTRMRAAIACLRAELAAHAPADPTGRTAR